jgi:hypothetical protein
MHHLHQTDRPKASRSLVSTSSCLALVEAIDGLCPNLGVQGVEEVAEEGRGKLVGRDPDVFISSISAATKLDRYDGTFIHEAIL